MKKKISLIFIVILGLALYSCSTMSSDEFVYLGHPKSLSEYHIYYDKTQNLYTKYVEQIEKILITQALNHFNGKKINAASNLGIGRNTIARKIKDLGI